MRGAYAYPNSYGDAHSDTHGHTHGDSDSDSDRHAYTRYVGTDVGRRDDHHDDHTRLDLDRRPYGEEVDPSERIYGRIFSATFDGAISSERVQPWENGM